MGSLDNRYFIKHWRSNIFSELLYPSGDSGPEPHVDGSNQRDCLLLPRGAAKMPISWVKFTFGNNTDLFGWKLLGMPAPKCIFWISYVHKTLSYWSRNNASHKHCFLEVGEFIRVIIIKWSPQSHPNAHTRVQIMTRGSLGVPILQQSLCERPCGSAGGRGSLVMHQLWSWVERKS